MSELTSYAIDKELLPPELRSTVVECAADAELEAFLEDCRKHPHTSWDFFRLHLLSTYMSDYEAHGALGMYPMHLLSTKQWEALIPETLRQGKLLDVGAGQGFVTRNARDLFSEIYATETSKSMTKRLRALGFITETKDVATHPNLYKEKEFDVISILNVLDRCEQPITLLRNCLHFLKDDGLLILTDPLPLKQTLRRKFGTARENLVSHQSENWEKNFVDLYETVLTPLALIPTRISRLPYVCKFTKQTPYIALDDFLVVCKKS